MPAHDPAVIRVAQGWIKKAESDFSNATNEVKRGKKSPSDTVCFHAQQTVEKYLKAVLVMKGIDFEKTHKISMLLALLPRNYRPELSKLEQETLSDFAVMARYPGDYEPISLADAKKAVAVARRVRGFIRKYIPAVIPEKP